MAIEYPKIETLYYRDEKTHKVIPTKWRLCEFEFLAAQTWLWTEKVDGTNIRVMWDGTTVRFGGRTDNAQMPVRLLQRLSELFPPERFLAGALPPTCLFGEGYGATIQKGGGNYKSDGVDFVMFDAMIGEMWLEWDSVVDIANTLKTTAVPLVGTGTLTDATKLVEAGFDSAWGKFPSEGLVVRPRVFLRDRQGRRIIGKLKTRDF